jgi:hypothetical protein
MFLRNNRFPAPTRRLFSKIFHHNAHHRRHDEEKGEQESLAL